MPLMFQVPSPKTLFPFTKYAQTAQNKPVFITNSVIETLTNYRQTGLRNEAGGVLLGRVWKDQVIVECVSTPGKGDKAGRNFFERDSSRAQRIIEKAWRESDGEINYLGEWHTHSELYPKPSSRDRAIITEIFNGARVHHGTLFLLIFGTQSIWMGQRDEYGLHKLKARK